MFQTASNLKTLRDALSSHMELPEYFLGMHGFFDGEVIFARDVVHSSRLHFQTPSRETGAGSPARRMASATDAAAAAPLRDTKGMVYRECD